MPDPLKPGHIYGQNPNTPERLQGEMNIGRRSGRLYAIAAAMLVLGIGMLLLFAGVL